TGEIIKSMVTSARIGQSSKLALQLSGEIPSNNRGVKKAPFYVLAGTYMPSVLLELGFISNPEDFKNLNSDQWLNDMAARLAGAIAKYLEKTERSKIYEG
ncbi:MAG: N-acetylmuramoyl-L-alanine amidase, partial [Oligoflexia bacterium]|nr:N-acetylmuramoyl-L-alanine amidase [Oligoflexia bacterium]